MVYSVFAGLEFISKCSQLSVLKLGICLNISDNGLIYIGNGCPNLRELDLYRFANLWLILFYTVFSVIQTVDPHTVYSCRLGQLKS